MNPLQSLTIALAGWLLTASSGFGDDSVTIPTIHHPNIAKITLFAQDPDIVTPTGIAVAPDGRVFVQENHTHKRARNYGGPATDRILIFEDSDGDGNVDRRSVFYEGLEFSTDLLFAADGSLYATTRWDVLRFPNAANLEKATAPPELVIHCDTESDYPHDGVGGLAIDPGDPMWLYFGFGENIGKDYTFVGTDGTRISGGAEGGSTYRCRLDGSELERLSQAICSPLTTTRAAILQIAFSTLSKEPTSATKGATVAPVATLLSRGLGNSQERSAWSLVWARPPVA
jgi:hypothetical protein